MIKWAGFGKLLRQFFFILLISCFILLGNSYVSAVNATNFQMFPVGIDKSQSYWNGSFEVGFLPKGRFLSMYLGSTKNLIALDSQMLFWWGSNGGLYMFNNRYSQEAYNYGLIQGFFQYIYSCDAININLTGNDILRNCSTPTRVGVSSEIVSNFMSSIKQGDYVYIEDTEYCMDGCQYKRYTIEVCFSSSSIGNTLCFIGQKLNTQSYQSYLQYPLTQSQNLSSSTNFASISRDYLSEPPGFTYGGDLEGSVEIDVNNILTGDYNYVGCTYGEIISELESAGFNKYMCYGGIDNFDLYDSSLSYNPIPGTGLRLSQILINVSSQGAWSSFDEWYRFWDGLYSDRYNNNYNAMWESYPAVYRTWFDLYYQYGRKYNKSFDYVREYCAMTVDINVSPDTKYNGTYFAGVCDTVNDKKINSSYYVGSGNSAVGTNWNGVGNLSGVSISNDPLKFIQDFFNLSKENVLTKFDLGLGFLPTYIITFLLALILFRFLRH